MVLQRADLVEARALLDHHAEPKQLVHAKEPLRFSETGVALAIGLGHPPHPTSNPKKDAVLDEVDRVLADHGQ
jgi:hypothetical protein